MVNKVKETKTNNRLQDDGTQSTTDILLSNGKEHKLTLSYEQLQERQIAIDKKREKHAQKLKDNERQEAFSAMTEDDAHEAIRSRLSALVSEYGWSTQDCIDALVCMLYDIETMSMNARMLKAFCKDNQYPSHRKGESMSKMFIPRIQVHSKYPDLEKLLQNDWKNYYQQWRKHVPLTIQEDRETFLSKFDDLATELKDERRKPLKPLSKMKGAQHLSKQRLFALQGTLGSMLRHWQISKEKKIPASKTRHWEMYRSFEQCLYRSTFAPDPYKELDAALFKWTMAWFDEAPAEWMILYESNRRILAMQEKLRMLREIHVPSYRPLPMLDALDDMKGRVEETMERAGLLV